MRAQNFADTFKRLDALAQRPYLKIVEDPPELVAERLKYESSLFEFVKGAWPYIGTGHDFVSGWHIEAICEHLTATISYSGEKPKIVNLLINQPPRTTKSSITAVIFPAFCFLHNPKLQFLYASYAQSLSVRDSTKCRRLIQSPWYQKLWGNRYHLVDDVNTKIRFENNQGGYRLASSMHGAVVGEGGDYLICDDPNSREDVQSIVRRDSTNDCWDQGLAIKLNNPHSGVRIIQMQRLHEDDLTGHLLATSQDDWVHLMLPMELDITRRCKTVILPTSNGKIWTDPRKKNGDLLWPERIDAKELAKIKRSLGSAYNISSQLQQNPSPEEGGVFARRWFTQSMWMDEKLPKIEYIIQSWDTAMTKKIDLDTGCYSACTTWGIFKDRFEVENIMLLDIWRGMVDHPVLLEMAMRLYKNYQDVDVEDPLDYEIRHPDMVLVENKANGSPLVSELNRRGIPATRFNPNKYGDKLNRAMMATPYFESGRVWFPGRPPNFKRFFPFVEEFMQACIKFKRGGADDLVDSCSQAFCRIREMQGIRHPDELPDTVHYEWETKNHGQPLYDA
jgi:predicted phage terminase large subunit-like protein